MEAKAIKELELKAILESLKIRWDVKTEKSKFKLKEKDEIDGADELFDEIDDTFAKVADIQSNK